MLEVFLIHSFLKNSYSTEVALRGDNCMLLAIGHSVLLPGIQTKIS